MLISEETARELISQTKLNMDQTNQMRQAIEMQNVRSIIFLGITLSIALLRNR